MAPLFRVGQLHSRIEIFFCECHNKILHRFFAEESRALVATVEYSVEIEHKWLQDTETCGIRFLVSVMFL